LSDWIARRCLVSGLVQGVYYRASARDEARALGVSGHARNLSDGRVEVLACGPAPAVERLCAWLWRGSPASRVDSIVVEEVPVATIGERPASFTTR